MDRNTLGVDDDDIVPGSPPARVAWIETQILPGQGRRAETVATREGGVDRNNLTDGALEVNSEVATREGGVDRNQCQIVAEYSDDGSPPARVAWIETKIRRTNSAPTGCRHPRGWRG